MHLDLAAAGSNGAVASDFEGMRDRDTMPVPPIQPPRMNEPMNRKAIVLACASLLLVTTAACSSDSDDAKVVSTEVEDTTTTTADQTTDTTARTTTTAGSDSPDASGFTEEQTTCIVDGVKGAPALGAYSSDQDLVETGSQADKETYYTILVDCAGVTPLVESFMTGFSSSTAMDADGLACVRLEAELLTDQEMILLKSGDPTVAADLTAAITTNCV